ncbi:MAG: hypothetical protein ACR2RV_15905 [Verrucomicrobiales bacterium]
MGTLEGIAAGDRGGVTTQPTMRLCVVLAQEVAVEICIGKELVISRHPSATPPPIPSKHPPVDVD